MDDTAAVATPDPRVAKLEKEKKALQERLEFVEELIGPTEAQRKVLQEQVLAARAAAIRAKGRGAAVPTKVAGRLDDRLMWTSGLSERDAGLLQGGCLPNKEGILQDVSLLGDPNFQPYNEQTGELEWSARGGVLQLSLGEVRNRFGEGVARDVVRCARELDQYDASRRVGVELPWHPIEDRELEPAEVIDFMERELSLRASLLYLQGKMEKGNITPTESPSVEHYTHVYSASPYAAVNAPPRRGRAGGTRQSRGRPSGAPVVLRSARGRSAGGGLGASAVVPLPRVAPEGGRRGAAEPRCGPAAAPSLAGGARPQRMQETLDHPLLGCHDRIRLV